MDHGIYRTIHEEFEDFLRGNVAEVRKMPTDAILDIVCFPYCPHLRNHPFNVAFVAKLGVTGEYKYIFLDKNLDKVYICMGVI